METKIRPENFCGPNSAPQKTEKNAAASLGFRGPPKGPFCLRFHFPNGEISAKDFLALREVSRYFSNGELRLTLRQGVEIPEIAPEIIPSLTQYLEDNPALYQALYAHRFPACCPLSGLCPLQHFDVRPYSEFLTPSDPFFKTGFSACGKDCGQVALSELGLIAELRNGMKGFRVYAHSNARSEETLKVFDWIPAEALPKFRDAYRNVLKMYGWGEEEKAPRLPQVIHSLGLEVFRARMSTALGFREELVWKNGFSTPSHNLQIEEAGAFRLWPQKDPDRVALEWTPPSGRLDQAFLENLTYVLRAYSNPLRLGLFQNLFVTEIPEEEAMTVAVQLSGGSMLQSRKPHYYLLSCVGHPVCEKTEADTQALARDIRDALNQEGYRSSLEGLVLSVSGCGHSCARYLFADIGFAACVCEVSPGKTEPRYRVTWGGKVDKELSRPGTPLGAIPSQNVIPWLRDVIEWVGGVGINLRDGMRTAAGRSFAERLLQRHDAPEADPIVRREPVAP